MSKKPPSKCKQKYAVCASYIGGDVWTGFDSAKDARVFAWDRRRSCEPTIWRRTPDGWTQLKPDRPKPSGTRGYGGGNPELRLRAPQAEIDGWRKRAAKEGLELQDWVRKVLRGAQ